MLTLREAFEIAQADCPNACEVIFPRLRQLARNGQIAEDILLAVMFATDRRRLRDDSGAKPRSRAKSHPIKTCVICGSSFGKRYGSQKTCLQESCRREHRLRRMRRYDSQRPNRQATLAAVCFRARTRQ